MKCIELTLCRARLFLHLILCETWEGGLWVFSGANGYFWLGASLGWGISPGPPLSNYINIYLYLSVPVWGQEESAKDQQSSLLHFTRF